MAVYFLLALCVLKPTATGAVRVAAIPDYIKPTVQSDKSFAIGNVADVQSCLDAAYDADPSFELISFNNATGNCRYGSQGGIVTPFTLASSGQPAYWVRIDQQMNLPAVTSCLSDQDARYLLMQLSYKGRTCLANGSVDSVTGLCTGSDDLYAFTDYYAGWIKDGPYYYLTRAQAADSVKYVCDTAHARKIKFGGTWYCYYSHSLNASEKAQGARLITGDYCSQLFGSTAHAVKIDEEREIGFICAFAGSTVYLGLTLRSGTTYQWYDGTVASGLTWAPGRPLGGSNTLGRIINGGRAVEDTSSPPNGTLVCKKPATPTAYDACSKFKTCT